MGSNCAGQLADVALSTTHGTLQAGITSGKNIIVRTSSSGTASATLVADTTPGVATVTASANGVAATDQVYMYGLTLTAPDELAADGAASGIVTAALDCNGTAPPIDDYLREQDHDCAVDIGRNARPARRHPGGLGLRASRAAGDPHRVTAIHHHAADRQPSRSIWRRRSLRHHGVHRPQGDARCRAHGYWSVPSGTVCRARPARCRLSELRRYLSGTSSNRRATVAAPLSSPRH